MSDQIQEESVSLHPHIESPQPPIVVEPTATPQPPVQVFAAPVPAPEQPIVPPIQPAPAPQQTVPQESFEERTTPFIADDYDDQPPKIDMPDSVTWTASEYIAHKKNLSWYLILGAGVAVLTVFIFFITGGDIFSSLCVLVLAIIFGVYAGRQPKEQQYVIDENGVSIGSRTYSFQILKSFSVIEEGPFSSIVFVPMKRFMPLISIYYDPVDEEKIVEYLSSIMPMEYRKRDNIERLMHKIKF